MSARVPAEAARLTRSSQGADGLEAAPRVAVVCAGSWDQPTFAEPLACLEQDADVRGWVPADETLAMLASGAPIDLVVLAQQAPRQFRNEWVAEVRRRAPLARIIVVLGFWCEGEQRSGAPIDADARLYWHQFAPWWNAQMKRLREGALPAWELPDGSLGDSTLGLGATPATEHRTASARECDSGHAARNARRGLVLVAARDRESAVSLATACACGGWATTWARWPAPLPVALGACAMIYDASALDGGELSEIEQLRGRYGPLPVVALADFPSPDRAAAGRQVGVERVLGKPYRVEDLLWTLDEVCPTPGA